jgi:cytochrome c oxidase subunit 2
LPLLLLTALSAASTGGQADSPRVIKITAKRFGFTPNRITLNRGETVTLRLRSEDVTHGFFLRPLKIDGEIEPGKTTEITLTPDVAGTFTIICDHFCGVGHGNMKMTVVVE